VNNGEQENYEVILKKESELSVWAVPVARTSRAVNFGYYRNKVLKAAVIRDGKVVYNEGLHVTSKHLDDFRKILLLRKKAIKYGYCFTCDLTIPFPGRRFCPRCGAETQPILPGESPIPSESMTAEPSQKAPSDRGKSCIVCKRGFERGEYIAWCPYCGRPAHKIELVKWLNDTKHCPSCNQPLDRKEIEVFQAPFSSDQIVSAYPENKGEEKAAADVEGSVASRNPLGACIVCSGKLYEGDQVVQCPYCGGLAHRGDLLEWRHVKGNCPSCGRKLYEEDFTDKQKRG
jgi:NADH pyrophosphatase NudC (nudix superfamily)